MIGLCLIMFSKFKKLFLILSIVFTSKVTLSSETNLIKSLSNTGNHKIFIRILESSPLFLSLVNNTVSSTIYAPTDKAFSLMPDSFMREINNNNIKYTTKIILTHIFSGNSLETNKNEGLVLSLDGSLYYTYDTNDLFVKDIVVQGKVTSAGNFTIIPVDCVMFLQQSSKDYRLDKAIQDKYKFTSCCLQTPEEYEVFKKGL